MADKLDPVVLVFGGGINRRTRPFDLNPQECYEGYNFDLDHQFSALHRRSAIQLRGTAPNAEAIRGYAQLITNDHTVTTLIQAGGNVYQWDGGSTFTLIGTCSPSSRLRGNRDHNFNLDEYTIITDLEKLTVVKRWDGTAFSDFPHNLSSALYAKYCRIHKERCYFGNVTSGTNTPHVLLASELSDPTMLTISNRPSSSLSAADPFFLPTPDLRAINGLEKAFGQFVISTHQGQQHILTGNDAQDFEMDGLHEGSAAAGDEAMVNIGNDVLIGLPGRLDMLSGVIQYGDVETDDVSLWIQPLISEATEWRLAYDRTVQKVYCFPDSADEIWVLHKSLLTGEQRLSPWSRWKTNHPVTFQPSCVMTLLDPSSNQDAVFIGDNTGGIYKLEGLGGQDGGTTDIETFRRSIIFRIPDARIMNATGWITYLKAFGNTVNITFEWSGHTVFDQDISVVLPANEAVAVYNGSSYYNGTGYYNVGFAGRLTRKNFSVSGIDNYVQVTVTVDGSADFEIHEIGLRLEAADDR